MRKNGNGHPAETLSDDDLVRLCASVYSEEEARQDLMSRLNGFELARLRESVLMVPPAPREKSVLVDVGPATYWFPVYRWLGYSRVIAITKLDPDPNVNDCTIRDWEHSQCVEIYCCDAEKGKFPIDDGCADAFCCFEILEHLAADPMQMLSEANRVLSENGVLALTTPNIASWSSAFRLLRGDNPNYWSPYATDPSLSSVRHHREYTVREVGSLAESAGMQVEKLWTPRLKRKIGWKGFIKKALVSAIVLLTKGTTRDREAHTFLLARKVGGVADRHPKWLYHDFLQRADM
jgi:SAM-dependent methyltransferase